MLDLLAVALSGGLGTLQIPADSLLETGLSQIFLAVEFPLEERERLIDQIVEFTLGAKAAGSKVRYPGQHTLEIRKKNLAEGIPVNETIWRQVQEMDLTS